MDEIPLYLSARTPDILAKHWIVSGTEKQQESAVRILGELQPEDDRATFYESLVKRDVPGMAVRMEAIHQLGNMAEEHNVEEAHEKLVQFTRSKKLNISLRAECVATLLSNNITAWDREHYGNMDFERSLLCNTMTSDVEALSPFAQRIAGYELKLDTPESRKLAANIITTRKPHDVALGLMWNETAIKLLGKEMIRIALDDNTDVDLRYSAIAEDTLPWAKGERTRALKAFLLSKKVPMRDKIDRLDSNWGNGTIRGIAHECMDAASRHNIALRFYQSGAPFNGKTISFLMNMWDETTGDPKVLNAIASRAMTAIADGSCSSPKSFFRFLQRFKVPGRIDFFKRMVSPEQSKTTRLHAIEHLPDDPALFPTLIKIAEDETEDLTIRKQAIRRMGTLGHPTFIPVINKLSNNADLEEYALEQMWEDPAFDPYHVEVINNPKYPYNLKTNSAYYLSNTDLQIKLALDPKTNDYARRILLSRLALSYDELTTDQQQKILEIISTDALDLNTRLYIAFELPPTVLFEWLKKTGDSFDVVNILHHIESLLLRSDNTPNNRAAVQGIFAYLNLKADIAKKAEKRTDNRSKLDNTEEKEIARIKNEYPCWVY